MKIKEYLNDKYTFLGINVILALIIISIMFYSKINIIIILIIIAIWFIPLVTFIFLDYLKYRRYFNTIENLLEGLDRAYLLPEIIEKQHFVIGDKINSILKTISRDMHENINHYKTIEKEYREYIDTWVHEIKTPIASSKLIIENNLNESTKKIDIEIDKIDYYVEQVLYYSKSENINKDYLIKKINLKDIILKVIKQNSKNFINNDIKIILNSIDNYVYTDSKWIEFILNQIIVNSIKYINNDNGKVEIETKKELNSIVLTIKDNGIGISEKDINQIFEKGFTGENGRLYGKSTGIGLYLCNNLATKLGLKLNINSSKNISTTVTIEFPLDDKKIDFIS